MHLHDDAVAARRVGGVDHHGQALFRENAWNNAYVKVIEAINRTLTGK